MQVFSGSQTGSGRLFSPRQHVTQKIHDPRLHLEEAVRLAFLHDKGRGREKAKKLTGWWRYTRRPWFVEILPEDMVLVGCGSWNKLGGKAKRRHRIGSFP